MATKRFKDQPLVTGPSLNGADAIPFQQNSSDDDKHTTFTDLATFLRTEIGDATTGASGFMSAADKTKSDSYPVDGPINKSLNTDGAGNLVLEDQTAGDMTKAAYATASSSKVDTAIEGDKISGGPGADKLYETDGGSVQQFTDKSLITVGLATDVVGAPGNLQTYGTNAAGAKGFKSDLSMKVLQANTALGLVNALVREWSGQTTDGAFNEIFLLGVASDRFQIADGELWGFELTIIGGKDDETGTFYGKRTGVIKRTGATTSLLGAIQTIGTDIVVGVTPNVQVTADNGNDALKIEVKGVNPETWDWRITGILIKKD